MASIEELRAAARRRVPRFAFDYFDGAAEGEAAMARNRAAFDACTLTPRVLRDVGGRDMSVELLTDVNGVRLAGTGELSAGVGTPAG